MSIRKHIDLIESELSHEDTLSFDVPLFIRVLEFTRETLKSDEQLHKFVERLLSMKGRVLTMDDYDDIMRGHGSEGGEAQPAAPVEEDAGPQGPEQLIAMLSQKAQEGGDATAKLVDDQEPVALVVAKAKMGTVKFFFKSLDKDRRKTKHFSLNPTMAIDAKRAATTLEMIATRAVGRLRAEGQQAVDESAGRKKLKSWWMKGQAAK